MSVYDEDDINSDDHVDDVYVEHNLNPGGSVSQVSSDIIIISWLFTSTQAKMSQSILRDQQL